MHIVEYLSTFTEPEANNYFNIITKVFVRATAFSSILFISFSETSGNRAAAILKVTASLINKIK